MGDKKLFVVLEQGKNCNTDIALKHKEQFTTDYSDWVRLNWKEDYNDKTAHIYKKNIVWSEGRSLLFDHVRGKYEYYIFIDDDVDFTSNTERSVSEELKYFFETYKPLSGTLHWKNNWAFRNYKDLVENDKKEVFPIVGFDLCCYYFQEDFAETVFPVYFHGSERCMWYSQFLANKLHPEKNMVFTNISISNVSADVFQVVDHHDRENPQYIDAISIVKKFSELIINDTDRNDFLSWNGSNYVEEQNRQLYDMDVNKDPISFNKSHVSKIINPINNTVLANMPNKKTIAITASGPSRNRWVEKFNGEECITTVVKACTFGDVKTIIMIYKDNTELQTFMKNNHPNVEIVIVNDLSYHSTLKSAFSYDDNDVIIIAGDLYTLKPQHVRKYVDTSYTSAVARYGKPWGRALVSSDKKLIRRSDIGSDSIVLFGRKHIPTILSDEMVKNAEKYHQLFFPREKFNINKSNHLGTWSVYTFFFDIASSLKRKNEISCEIGSIFDEDDWYIDND
jgi:GTP:adenosylcobinamide-phosphate guanylyltransferase